MLRTLFYLLALCCFVSCQEGDSGTTTVVLEYPETKQADSTTTYFGTEVADPYRWLEDDRSTETEDWVKRQNKVSFGYLEDIPFREELKSRLEKLWNYEKIGSPFKEGKYSYYYKNNGVQNQYVIYRTKEDGTDEVFLDPNTFSEDGTIS
ncbi:MAG: S9 family peptidase, partial [Bacteroidota bacterium]